MNNNTGRLRKDGSRRWMVDGEYHRLDGPAIIWANGQQDWYQNGKRYRLDGPVVIDSGGTQYWYKNHEHHRVDGPAVIFLDGSETWLGIPTAAIARLATEPRSDLQP